MNIPNNNVHCERSDMINAIGNGVLCEACVWILGAAAFLPEFPAPRNSSSLGGRQRLEFAFWVMKTPDF